MSEPPNDWLTVPCRPIAYYSEPEAALHSRLEIQIIRQLAENEVIGSIEVTNEEQRYGAEQLVLLRRARRLYQDLGINLEGVEVIMRLVARIEGLQRELARYQRMAGESAPTPSAITPSATNEASTADQQQHTEEYPL